MMPLEGLLLGPTVLLYLLNLAIAVSALCAVGLISARLLKGGSAPLRHGVFVSILMLVALAPVLVGLAQKTGSGVVRIAVNDSTSRDEMQALLPAMSTDLPSEINSISPSDDPAPEVQTSAVDPQAPALDAALSTVASATTQPEAATATVQGVSRFEKIPVIDTPQETKTMPRVSEEFYPQNQATGAHGSVSWWSLAGSVIAGVWAVGIAVGLARLLHGTTRLARLRRSLKTPAAPCFEHAGEEAADRAGLRQAPPVYVSPFVPTPISMGLFRPVIVLPEGFERQVSESQLRAILLHEAAHVARGDVWVGLLERLIAILHWWNPLTARLNHRLRSVREEICDNYVLQSPGSGPLYAEALVEMAARVSAATRLPSTVGILDAKLDGLGGRIQRLINHRAAGTTMVRLNRTSRFAIFTFGLSLTAILMISNVRADKPFQDTQRVAEDLLNAVATRINAVESEEQAPNGARRAAEEQIEPDQADERLGEAEIQALLEAAELLAELGPFADSPQAVYDQPAPQALFGSVAQRLSRLPAEPRYQLLRRWTLPADERPTVRLLASFVPLDGPPPEFQAMDYRPLAKKGVLSSSDLLIESAREAGKLDDLGDALLEAANAGIPNAEAFSLLVEIARGNGDDVRAQIEQNLTALPSKLAEANRASRFQPMEWIDLLLARACLNDPAFRSLGESYARTLAGYPKKWSTLRDSFIGHVMQDLIEASFHDNRDSSAGWDPQLTLWEPVSELNSIAHRIGRVPSYWYAENGEVEHRLGPMYDYLYFAYPLTGSFEFSADSYFVRPSTPFIYAPSTYSCISYGALVSDRTMMWVVGMQDRFFPESPVPVEKDFLRVTVKAEPGRLRFLHQGSVFYEETNPSPTSPWLALNGVGASRARFRNLTLTGSPVIPREVRLTHENRLDGWISSYYFETQPQQARNAERRRTLNIMPWAEPEHADWYADNGVIYGRQRSGPPQAGTVQSQLYYQYSEIQKFDRVWNDGLLPVPSRLYYHRPLRDGEQVSYEFLYEPSKTLVHPALGRLAFLLEPEGVRLHWITDTAYDDPTGLPHDNVIAVAQERRGPERLPLKPGEWNQATVSFVGGTVFLQLNGEDVYERKLDSANRRKFGFFHWKDRTGVEVRNVILRGDWPEALSPEQLTDLIAPKAPAAVAQTPRRAAVPLFSPHKEHIASQIAKTQNPTPIVWCVAYSPDGSTLATAGGHWSNPGTIRLWDVAQGRELLTFTEPLGARTVAFSPDGQQLASGNYHGMVTLRALPTGKVLAEMQGHGAPVNSVRFSPDGSVLATAGADGTIRLWKLPTGEPITTLRGHTDRVYFLALSPDGTKIASGSKDRTAKLWDTATGEVLHTLGHRSVIESVCFSPDGTKIITGSWDGTAKIWNSSSGELLTTIEGNMAGILSVAFSSDGKTLATGGSGGIVKLWNSETAAELGTLEGHEHRVYGLEFSPDGKTLATGSWDKTTRLWDVATHEQIAILTPERGVARETASKED